MGNLDEKIIVRFLAGECSEEELRAINAWLEESKEHARELFTYEELYHLGKTNDISEHRITQEGEKKLLHRIEIKEKERQKHLARRRWMQYAAIFIGLVFLSGVGTWFYQSLHQKPEPQVMVIARETTKELMLPDGTKVWLNKNTTLKYPRTFAGDNRLVYLDGEGYFDVKRNPSKPFIVHSNAMQVKVLGTVFNLKSGKDGQKSVATLLKGEVEVKGKHGEGMVVLLPGQQAELDGTTRRLTVKPAEAGVEGWHGTSFNLNQTDIYTLCKLLEKAYDVKLILAPDIDSTRTYSGTLKKKETVGATLDLIKKSIGIDYKIVGGNVFLSSSKEK